MAIKYVNVPEQKKTIAILENCKYSAVNQIAKIIGDTDSMCFNPNKYLMNDVYRAVVVCHPDDEYSLEEGKKQAKKKLLDHYYEALDKRVDMWVEDVNKLMYETVSRLSAERHSEKF
jgi:hypothetical protein